MRHKERIKLPIFDGSGKEVEIFAVTDSDTLCILLSVDQTAGDPLKRQTLISQLLIPLKDR